MATRNVQMLKEMAQAAMRKDAAAKAAAVAGTAEILDPSATLHDAIMDVIVNAEAGKIKIQGEADLRTAVEQSYQKITGKALTPAAKTRITKTFEDVTRKPVSQSLKELRERAQRGAPPAAPLPISPTDVDEQPEWDEPPEPGEPEAPRPQKGKKGPAAPAATPAAPGTVPEAPAPAPKNASQARLAQVLAKNQAAVETGSQLDPRTALEKLTRHVSGGGFTKNAAVKASQTVFTADTMAGVLGVEVDQLDDLRKQGLLKREGAGYRLTRGLYRQGSRWAPDPTDFDDAIQIRPGPGTGTPKNPAGPSAVEKSVEGKQRRLAYQSAAGQVEDVGGVAEETTRRQAYREAVTKNWKDPQAFARQMSTAGGAAERAAVEAGWRNPQPLAVRQSGAAAGHSAGLAAVLTHAGQTKRLMSGRLLPAPNQASPRQDVTPLPSSFQKLRERRIASLQAKARGPRPKVSLGRRALSSIKRHPLATAGIAADLLFLPSMIRGLTDSVGITKSEEDRATDRELKLLEAQQESPETRLLKLDIAESAARRARLIESQDPGLSQLMQGLPETTRSEVILGAKPDRAGMMNFLMADVAREKGLAE